MQPSRSEPASSAAPATQTPYAGLSPHEVLDALDDVGLRPDGTLLQLNSYENRVYQAGLDDGRTVVAKFYRPARWSDAQILEEHEFALELAAAEVPAVAPLALSAARTDRVTLAGNPPTLALSKDWRFAVSPRCAGRSPELDAPGTLERIGSFLGRLHSVGRRKPFTQRVSIRDTGGALAAVEWLAGRDDLLTEPGRGPWLEVAREALAAAAGLFDRAGRWTSLRLHGDCHVGNLLWTDTGAHFVDLDDACNGPAVHDLWMLLSGSRAERQSQLIDLLVGYESFCEFNAAELVLIEALRTMRIIQHSAWVARRWDDPAFPAAFPMFASPAYWQQQTMQLREQLEAMAEEPLVF